MGRNGETLHFHVCFHSLRHEPNNSPKTLTSIWNGSTSTELVTENKVIFFGRKCPKTYRFIALTMRRLSQKTKSFSLVENARKHRFIALTMRRLSQKTKSFSLVENARIHRFSQKTKSFSLVENARKHIDS